MKITDIITDHVVTEAPVGYGSRLKNWALSKLPGDRIAPQAQGRTQVGATANQLSSEFNNQLGRTGDPATAQAVLNFLRSKRYPITAAQAIANKGVGVADPVDNTTQTAATTAQPTPGSTAKLPTPTATTMAPSLDSPITPTKVNATTTTPSSNELAAIKQAERNKKLSPKVSALQRTAVREDLDTPLNRKTIDAMFLAAAQENEKIKVNKSIPQASATSTAQSASQSASPSVSQASPTASGSNKGVAQQIATLSQRLDAIEKKVGS